MQHQRRTIFSEQVTKRRCVAIFLDGSVAALYVALNVANYLNRHLWEVLFFGTPTDKRALQAKGYTFHLIDAGPRQQHWFFRIFTLIRGMIQVAFSLHRARAEVVLAIGDGFSGVGSMAAWLQRIPFLLYEPNRQLRPSYRWLLPFCDALLTGFSGTASEESVVGTPLPSGFFGVKPPSDRFARRKGPLRILVLSPSLEALVPEVLDRLKRPVELRYQPAQHRASPAESEAFLWADLVLGEGDACTISKMASVAVGGILMPLEASPCQTHNVSALVERGAAVMLPPGRVEALVHLLESTPRSEWARRACLAYDRHRQPPARLIHQAMLYCTQHPSRF